MKLLEIVNDKALYKKIKKEADVKFKSPTSIYKSAWITKEYKKRGGTFNQKKTYKKDGLERWFKEKWVDLNRPIRNSKGKIIDYEECGRRVVSDKEKGAYPLCRPTYKISKETPLTYKEIPKKIIEKAKIEKSKLKWKGSVEFDVAQKGGSLNKKSQYYGRKSSVMIKVPESVKRVAVYSYKMAQLGFKGGVETGWKRARQLSTKEYIPIQDLKFMRAWFARHIITSYPTYKKWVDAGRPKDSSWHNRRGIIAWLIWGGDPAFKWVNSKRNIKLLNEHYPGKNYQSMKLN